jgi:hypothetical protein
MAGGGRNKYRAKKAQCANGHTHDSGREAKRCDELHVRLAAGEITELEIQPQYWFVNNDRQVKHENGRRVGFKPDFDYYEIATDKTVAEDSKGFRTADYVLRAAIFRALFPYVELREV